MAFLTGGLLGTGNDSKASQGKHLLKNRKRSLVECSLQTRQALGLFGNRPHIFLADEGLGGRRTDHVAQPASVGRAPGGSASIAASVPQHRGFAAQLGDLASPQRLLTGAAAVTDGLVLDRRAFPSPHAPGPWDGSTAVGVDLLPSLLGDSGGRNDPTGIACAVAIALEPGATRPRFVDQAQVLSLRLPLADALGEVTLAGADGPAADNFRGLVRGHVGHGAGRLMDLQANIPSVRL